MTATADRRERERAARREAIVDAGERVLARRGLGCTKMEDVAAEAELSKGALYLYFQNKDALCAAVAERLIGRFIGRVRPELAHTTTGLEAVRRGLETMVGFYGEHPHAVRMLASWLALGLSSDVLASPSFQAYRARVGEVMGLMIEHLDRGKDDGSIRPDVAVVPTALSIWGSLLGVCLITLDPSDLRSRVPLPLDVDSLRPLFVDHAVRAIASEAP